MDPFPAPTGPGLFPIFTAYFLTYVDVFILFLIRH